MFGKGGKKIKILIIHRWCDCPYGHFIYNLKSLSIHNGVLYNSQEQETIQCPSVTEWMHKWRPSHTVEFYTAESIRMINNHTQHVSDSHKFNVEWKKPDTKQSTLHDPIYLKHKYRDFLGGSVSKNPPANAGDTGSIPGPERFHMLRSNQAHEPQLPGPRAAITEAHLPRAHARQQEKPLQWDARAPQWTVAPACCN